MSRFPGAPLPPERICPWCLCEKKAHQWCEKPKCVKKYHEANARALLKMVQAYYPEMSIRECVAFILDDLDKHWKGE